MNNGQKTFARIGITGGIACGKSLVGQILSELGVAVRDADDVGHELMASKGELFNRIVAKFGRGIVGSDGKIDRSALGRIVFSDQVKRDELNRLVHPEISMELNAWINDCACRWLTSAAKENANGHWTLGIAVVVPLLYEVGWSDSWDWVICVAAPSEIQVERLKSRGLSHQEALSRINAQFPVEEKMKRADYVIFNVGTREQVKDQTLKAFQDIKRQMDNEQRRTT